jgi:hypothetical protein
MERFTMRQPLARSRGKSRDRRIGRAAPMGARLRVVLLAALVAVVLQGPAGDAPGQRSVEEQAKPAPEAGAACAAIAEAWRGEDHAALAARVAADGVEIAIHSQSGTRNHYSASQAFYFFKSLFTSTQQESFRFVRLQEERESGLLHAVAEWSYRRGGTGGVRSERLFFTLQKGEAGWCLTGVHAVR